MINQFHIPRKLIWRDKDQKDHVLTEQDLPTLTGHLLISAEPGAGKSSVLRSLENTLKIQLQKANVFARVGAVQPGRRIIVDGVDEMVRRGAKTPDDLFDKLRLAKPQQVILACRSNEWSPEDKDNFHDLVGGDLKILNLLPLEDDERRALFEHHFETENYNEFKTLLEQNQIGDLIGNPHILLMFAKGYLSTELDRNNVTKTNLFTIATNTALKEIGNLLKSISTQERASIVGELCFKMLVTGLDGVSKDIEQPKKGFVDLMELTENLNVRGALDTALFGPTNEEGHFVPQHRITAEFMAAQWVGRLLRKNDCTITPRTLVTVFGNQGHNRQDLRGLWGWLAIFAPAQFRSALITNDPYAVLANGAAQDLPVCDKLALLNSLERLNQHDPGFRRGDWSRDFQKLPFFSAQDASALKPFLTFNNDNRSYNEIVLELLAGSPAIPLVESELLQIVVDPTGHDSIRRQASRLLISNCCSGLQDPVRQLLIENSPTALKIATDFCLCDPTLKASHDIALEILEKTEPRLPVSNSFTPEFEGYYFLEPFILKMDFGLVQGLMERLSESIQCVCGHKDYECICRTRRSKIVHMLLYRFLHDHIGPIEPDYIAKVALPLHSLPGYDRIIEEGRISALRREMRWRMSRGMSSVSELYECWPIDQRAHKHPFFKRMVEDKDFLIDLAFEHNEVSLWEALHCNRPYKPNRQEQQRRSRRQKQRRQAREKPEFMKAWYRQEKIHQKLLAKGPRPKPPNAFKKRKAREEKLSLEDWDQFKVELKRDRAHILAGHSLHHLAEMSRILLYYPEQFDKLVGDRNLAEDSLTAFAAKTLNDVPTPKEIGDAAAKERYYRKANILAAGCLILHQRGLSLSKIGRNVLMAALAAQINDRPGCSADDAASFNTSLHTALSLTQQEKIAFLANYYSSVLSGSQQKFCGFHLLKRDKNFEDVAAETALGWLETYPNISHHHLHELFPLAAKHKDRARLLRVIRHKVRNLCSQLQSREEAEDGLDDFERSCHYWFLADFYYSDTPVSSAWHWLTERPETVIILDNRSGQFQYSQGNEGVWPKFNAVQIEKILESFWDKWPKVYLSSGSSSHDPDSTKAYRFLTELFWRFKDDKPETALPIVERLLTDPRFKDFRQTLQSQRAALRREQALAAHATPSIQHVNDWIAGIDVSTPDGLKALVLDLFDEYQEHLDGSPLSPKQNFRKSDGLPAHKSENDCRNIIGEWIEGRLKPKGIDSQIEVAEVNSNRSDFQINCFKNGARVSLPIEVKGQWHPDLFTAAETQLAQKYMINPDCANNGIYLVLWFGGQAKLAGRVNNGKYTANSLLAKLSANKPDGVEIVVVNVEISGLMAKFAPPL